MMNKGFRAGCALLVLAASARLAHANDRYEFASFGINDDVMGLTFNELKHGYHQMHDLQAPSAGVADEDWMYVQTKLRHSYEARLLSQSSRLDTNTQAGCAACAHFQRADPGGGLQQESIRPTGFIGFDAMRWVNNGGDQFEFLHVVGSTSNGDLTSSDVYEVEFFDTTYFVPRWNNANGQVTVFLIQNDTAATVNGSVHFYNGAGALLSTQPVSVAPYALQVINTASIGALAGQSGSATIVHNGGWGALSGKAVALESATGFSFDTPFTSMQR